MGGGGGRGEAGWGERGHNLSMELGVHLNYNEDR